MKKLLLLATLVLGAVSCMKDQSVEANLGGDGNLVVTVALPDAATRAAGNDSSVGAIGNIDLGEYDIRYVLEVFDARKELAKRLVQFEEEATSTTFELRLIPGRNYNFVVWADFVKRDADGEVTMEHYNVADLRNVTFAENSAQRAMDESRDAYTGVRLIENFNSTSSVEVILKRPFAKLRIKTNDLEAISNYSELQSATVNYTSALYTSFDALVEVAGELKGNVSKSVNFTEDAYLYANEPVTNGLFKEMTLFADYLFGTEDGTVQFTLDIADNKAETIPTIDFNTTIPVERNHLTTIYGPILTDYNKATVRIEDAFVNKDNWDESPFYQVAVTNGVELIKALMAGKEVIALNNITATYADLVAATRAATPVYPVINLNGFTITIENENADALVNLNGGALTVQGEGDIVSTKGALVKGTTVVTEGATVEPEVAVDENGDSAVKTGVKALAYICENGGEFTFTEDLAISEVLLASTTNPVVINGANFTLTSSASRAIRATVANANIVVNDLNIDVTTERVYPNDIRGISIDTVTGVELTLNNCSVIFSHPSGNDWAYAVNVTGGSNHKVTVNGGIYNGANVINVRGSENTVIVKNATLNCEYPFNDLYAGACIWVLQKQNTSVYAEGNTFNGNNAWAFNLGAGTELEEKNNTDNTKYVAAKVNGAYYYNIAAAITAAEDGATIKVLQNHDCNVSATVPAGKTLTIDLNGKTVKGTDTITSSFGLITNKGNLTITGNGKMTLKAENNRGWNAYSSVISNTVGGKLVVENGTIEHLGGTDMAYGIDNLTNGQGTYAETVINGGTIKSTYRAVRMFLNGTEAQNLLTVNGGIIEGANKSIWMQDSNVKANTGNLVVNEGATLNGNVYLTATEGSTEWPVEVSIAASAVNGEVLTGSYVPAGYAVRNVNGAWKVLKYTVVNTPAAIRSEVAKDNAVVYIENGDYKLEGKLSFGKNAIILGNGASLFNDWGSDAFAKQAHFTNTYVENINFTNNLIINAGIVTGDVKFVNCVFGGNLAHQGVHFDSGKGTLTFDDCTFVGRNMLGASIEKVAFNHCTFLNKKSSQTAADLWTGVNMWGKYEFNNCIFDTEAHCNVKCDGVVATFTDCTNINGEAISAEIINGAEKYASTITFK